jgi:hypothetical protein
MQPLCSKTCPSPIATLRRLRVYPLSTSSLAPVYMLTPFGDDPEPYFSKRGLIDVQVPEHYLRCAVFIGVKRGDNFLPRATGFVASYDDGDNGYNFWHLVTAEHVISGIVAEAKERLWLRANFKDGSAGEIELPLDQWHYHPDERLNTDVAVCPLHQQFVRTEDDAVMDLDHLAVRLFGQTSVDGQTSMAITDELLAGDLIRPGAEICIVGLFRSHYGRERNTPIMRVGNIAMLKGDPISTKFKGYMDAYLIEARSIGGLSGSPVFVSVLRGMNRVFYLLGLVHGHFDIADMNSDVVNDTEGGSINTGIGVVIPTRYVVETLRHPDLIKLREDARMALRKRGGATPDLAVEPVNVQSDDQPATKPEENPAHREDFNRLVSAASKSKPKAGRT